MDIKVLVYGMTWNRGGIESYLMYYFKLLREKGIVFDFVTEHQKIAYQEEIEAAGSKIYRIPSRREGLMKHMVAIRNILLEHKEYKIVYFNILSASEVFTVMGAAGIGSVKKIVHAHANSVQTKGRHRMLRPLLAMLSDVKLACSDSAADFIFGKRYRKAGNVEIINNAIDIEKYAYHEVIRKKVRSDLGIGETQFVVGHVGRICHAKNTLFLVDVFKKILEKDADAMLLLAGDGEDRDLLREKIEQSKIQDHVLTLGLRNDVEQLMQAMDVFVLPSRFEGFGIVLLEAQAAGLPCITSKYAVPEATNVGGDVVFVELTKSAEDWADIVLQRKNAGRKDYTKALIEAGFSGKEVGKKIEKIFKDSSKG